MPHAKVVRHPPRKVWPDSVNAFFKGTPPWQQGTDILT
jgi:hypothetical protein